MTQAPSTADALTLAFYDDKAADYARQIEEKASRAPLLRFLDGLAPGAALLDFGCGAGWASTEMLARGFAVRAIDGSSGLAAQARARGVPAEVMLFEEFDEPGAYDGVWASFSLLHAPRAAFPGLLATLRRALRPGGRLYLGMKLGQGEHRDDLGRRYAYFSEAELRDALAAAGFEIDETETEVAPGMAGIPEPCLHVHAHA